MVQTKSVTLKKSTTITFSESDIEKLVTGMRKFLEDGEFFNIALEDKNGNEVIITLEEGE